MTGLLIDAQLPQALARWIEGTGHFCLHVADIQMSSASDRAIWSYALERGLTIISKDEDFARRRSLETTGPAIVWLRWPNTRRRELLSRFAEVFPSLLALLRRGELLVEVR